MRARTTILAGVLFTTLGTGAAVGGDGFSGFRCNGRLVHSGETEDDVAGKCGDPDAVRTWTELRKESVWEYGHKVERQVPVQYDEWKYDFDSDRLIRYVLFTQGVLSNVRTGEYGRHR
jgi:hypothetical protein